MRNAQKVKKVLMVPLTKTIRTGHLFGLADCYFNKKCSCKHCWRASIGITIECLQEQNKNSKYAHGCQTVF